MFRFDYDLMRWIPFERKVAYTQRHEYYIDDDDIPEGLENVVVEDIILTAEQKSRLEQMKHVEDIGMDSLINYVMGNEIQMDNAVMVEVDKQAKTRKALLSSIDVSKVPSETLIEAGLTKELEDTEYFTVGELIMDEGVLYKVLQSHDKQSNWKPKVATSLFAKVLTSLDGTPKEWVQPDSTNAYKIGDKVLYKGVIWTSKINANVTIPDGDVPYNRYWTDKQTDKVKNK